MTYLTQAITTNITGGADYISMCRDSAGVLWACLYDFEAAPKCAKLWYSLTDGASWDQAVCDDDLGAPGANNGGDNPHIMCDPSGALWLGMSQYDGTSKPTVIKRVGHQFRWGVPLAPGEYQQWAINGATSVRWTLDAVHRLQGYYNIAFCYIDATSKVAYADLFVNTGEQVNVTGVCSDAHIVVSPGGVRTIAWIESSKAWYATKTDTGGAWSARIALSDAAHTVVSIEWLAINPADESMAAIYRANVGGTNKLFFAELDDAVIGTYTAQQVWDGFSDWGMYSGHSLAYDHRGSVFIAGYRDDSALGRAELTSWSLLRALDPTTTTWIATTPFANSDGDALQTCMMPSTPSFNGFRPSLLFQGSIFCAFVWPNGGAVGDQILYFVNPDTYDAPVTNYPTKFSAPTGEIPYPDDPTYAGVSQVLIPEIVGGAAFPIADAFTEIEETQLFVTSEARFESGWNATIARFPSGRRSFHVTTIPLNDVDMASVRTFLLARREDKASFIATLPDGSTVDVILTESIAPTKVGDGAWVYEFELLEIFS